MPAVRGELTADLRVIDALGALSRTNQPVGYELLLAFYNGRSWTPPGVVRLERMAREGRIELLQPDGEDGWRERPPTSRTYGDESADIGPLFLRQREISRAELVAHAQALAKGLLEIAGECIGDTVPSEYARMTLMSVYGGGSYREAKENLQRRGY